MATSTGWKNKTDTLVLGLREWRTTVEPALLERDTELHALALRQGTRRSNLRDPVHKNAISFCCRKRKHS